MNVLFSLVTLCNLKIKRENINNIALENLVIFEKVGNIDESFHTKTLKISR